MEVGENMENSKDFEDIKNSLDKAEAVCSLKDAPATKILKSLVEAVGEYFPQYAIIPIVAEGVGSIAGQILNNFTIKKRQELLEYISLSKEIITTDMVIDEQFIIEFANTINAIDKLAANDKIKYIANLFKNTFCVSAKRNIDEYDEWLQNLMSLSYREIEMLIMLRESEKNSEDINQFFEKTKDRFNITEEEAKAILTSATKSGFCREKTGAILGYSGGDFFTTEYFEKFLEKIKN